MKETQNNNKRKNTYRNVEYAYQLSTKWLEIKYRGFFFLKKCSSHFVFGLEPFCRNYTTLKKAKEHGTCMGKKYPLFCGNCDCDRNKPYANISFLKWSAFSKIEKVSQGLSTEKPTRVWYFPIGKREKCHRTLPVLEKTSQSKKVLFAQGSIVWTQLTQTVFGASS